jgi:RecT family
MSTGPKTLETIKTASLPENGPTLPALRPQKGGELEVGPRGFNLSTLDEAWRFCTAIADSGLAPKGMETPQKILYALELGFEVGLPPLAALQSVAVINGRASLYGDVMLGLCVASGKFDEDAFEEDWIRNDKNEIAGAYCVVRRLPKGKPKRWDFTIEDAKTAKLWGKEGPWSTMPKRMMQMRARAFCLRDVFPDVLKGILTREEAMDLPPEPTEKNITPTKPTTLSELTEQLVGDAAGASDTSTAAQGMAADPSSPATVAGATGGFAPASFEQDVDPRETLIAQLEAAQTVPDVTRITQLWLKPENNLLTPTLTAADVQVLCKSRSDAIRAERAARKGQQALPT